MSNIRCEIKMVPLTVTVVDNTVVNVVTILFLLLFLDVS